MSDINPTSISIPTSAASALIGDPAKFGYVAPDGTVFVKTSTGDKAVGSYPGKSAEEALAYFVRKFEAVASEIALLAARITSGAMVPSDALASVKKLRDQVKEINAVGDLEALLSESWKTTGDRLKELLTEWKSAPRLDKKTDTDLWKRFSASRNKFDKRRRTHFANLEATTSVVTDAKKNLVAEAEKLATSTDWVATAKAYKSLMDQWKAAGRGKPSDDAKLWARFKKAQDQFFQAKGVDLEKREVTMTANLAKREELIVQIEALVPFTDVKDAKNKFRDLARSWEKIGMTNRDKRAALDARVSKVEEAIKSAEAEIWRKTDPAAKARAAEVVTQLQGAIDNYEKIAAKATSAGNAKKAAEALESAAARRTWLEEAQKSLAEFN